MSLINEMLADLESRRGGNTTAGESALDGVRAAAPLPAQHARDVTRWLVAALIGVTAACAAFYALRLLQPLPAALTAVPATASAAAVVAVATPPVPEPAVMPADPARDEVVAASDNNTSALPPAGVALPLPQQPLEQLEALPAVVFADAEPIEVDAAASVAAPGLPEPAITDIKTELAAGASEDPPVEHTGTLRMQEIHAPPTPASALAALLRRTSDSADWRTELAEFVAAHPHLPSARTALVQAYLRMNDNARAETLLREGLELAPAQAEYARLLAHMLVARGDADAALTTLNALPATALDADLRAFIAALEQRRGRHDKAIAAYRLALNDIPRRGAWWVGLGISLRAEQQPGAAGEAFRRALSDRGLSPNLRQFAEGELGRLGGNS